MNYNLIFENENGRWNTTIYGKTKEEAIENARKFIKEKRYKNAKLQECRYVYKTIYDFEKENENNGESE